MDSCGQEGSRAGGIKEGSHGSDIGVASAQGSGIGAAGVGGVEEAEPSWSEQ